MPKLSVVVPVYNVEEYLDWCLDSLVAQTEADIEIVCVNDGSTDGSHALLEARAQNDSRFVVVDKPNGGLSSARNAGIDAASAPYVCFVDSDDRLVPMACERIIEAFAETDADVLTFGANCYPPEAGYPWLEDVLSPRDAIYDSFSMDILFKEKSRPFAWRTACKTAFLREEGICFDESVKFGEDQVFHFEVYPRSHKTAFISDKLYDYRVAREGSLMDRMSGNSVARLLEHVKVAEAIFKDWGSQGWLMNNAPKMAEWIVEFFGFEALKLNDEDYARVAKETGSFLSEYWSASEINQMDIHRSVRAIVQAVVFQPADLTRFEKDKLMVEYYVYRYGWKALLLRLLRR